MRDVLKTARFDHVTVLPLSIHRRAATGPTPLLPTAIRIVLQDSLVFAINVVLN